MLLALSCMVTPLSRVRISRGILKFHPVHAPIIGVPDGPCIRRAAQPAAVNAAQHASGRLRIRLHIADGRINQA